jgi:hypothetical protein
MVHINITQRMPFKVLQFLRPEQDYRMHYIWRSKRRVKMAIWRAV